MEENKLTTREKLKTYFEKGKQPTQSQFSDLIDSLKHKQDLLTDREVIILANRLSSINSPYISFANYTSENENCPIVISSQDEEDQIIQLGKITNGDPTKQYLLGKGPYSITAKEFSAKALTGTQYYYLRYQINSNYWISRLFGSNLPAISDGFNFGIFEDKVFYVEISKLDYGITMNIINTKIKFLNKTGESIQYIPSGGIWSYGYTAEDIVTDHYDASDFLAFSYKADLRNSNKSIECKVYNADNDDLLMTAYLASGQNNMNVSGGGLASQIRNLRVECNYMAE
ncbi:hypothetical protein LF887_15350 [Chryseobacterium sp. MEBOG06]|uniref:hypothetical protein n=1 Tax=Chryseobacterium sp. MEBOG06 TaxID=2879938 RepID=UPI001F20D467|nr:hypothetical protein [Chryseobacterium sp. MEBOG06]UKB82380.1 hypothetical protein LF887_15350 [Chryseobacterium sp. MEBOG06]